MHFEGYFFIDVYEDGCYYPWSPIYEVDFETFENSLFGFWSDSIKNNWI